MVRPVLEIATEGVVHYWFEVAQVVELFTDGFVVTVQTLKVRQTSSWMRRLCQFTQVAFHGAKIFLKYGVVVVVFPKRNLFPKTLRLFFVMEVSEEKREIFILAGV